MAFSGSLIDYPLAELLFYLSSSNRSGWLTVKGGESEITFTFDSGRLISAATSDFPARLGRRLVTSGRISDEMLETALTIQVLRDSFEPLGTTLLHAGYVRLDDVVMALRAQVVDLIFQIVTSSPGSFLFTRGIPLHAAHAIDVGIVPERDVLEAIRRADEWIDEQLWTATLRLNPETSADMLVNLIAQDWPVIDTLIDGARTINDIVSAIDWSMQDVYLSLRRLQSLDVIYLEPWNPCIPIEIGQPQMAMQAM